MWGHFTPTLEHHVRNPAQWGVHRTCPPINMHGSIMRGRILVRSLLIGARRCPTGRHGCRRGMSSAAATYRLTTADKCALHHVRRAPGQGLAARTLHRCCHLQPPRCPHHLLGSAESMGVQRCAQGYLRPRWLPDRQELSQRTTVPASHYEFIVDAPSAYF